MFICTKCEPKCTRRKYVPYVSTKFINDRHQFKTIISKFILILIDFWLKRAMYLSNLFFKDSLELQHALRQLFRDGKIIASLNLNTKL